MSHILCIARHRAIAAWSIGVLALLGAACITTNPRTGAPCGPHGATCGPGEYCMVENGTCGDAAQAGTCAPRPELCTLDYTPVCGCDGATYSNRCHAAAAGVSVNYAGECDQR